MWKIAKQSFGFVLTFAGKMDAAEMKAWASESQRQLSGSLPSVWGVVVDMRELQPLAPDAQAVLVEGQKAYKSHGMARSVVVLRDAVTTMQFRRLARQSGIDAWERYINAAQTPNWQAAAKHWVTEAAEPAL